ncbi:hypothetical protein N3K64_04670 [Escherichia coli]|uniref:hypothetical protein n=1 Tax=Escherichia coli TaxID=562 RepID=UPI0021C1140B|nr:hypothetical protein [Escherichia coli]MCT9829183.1 hypothetical protein [Escherichia coli]
MSKKYEMQNKRAFEKRHQKYTSMLSTPKRVATSPAEFTGKKPPVEMRVFRPVSSAA